MKNHSLPALVAGCLISTPLAAQTAGPTTIELTAEDEGAPPKPIDGVAATFQTPPRDADGAYLTPNRALSVDETIWHVRVALNVAALGCRGDDESTTVARYNALLAADRALLAAAAAGVEKRYQVKFGARWRSAHDDDMTRLYNFFAQTPAQAEFCAEAKAVLAEAQTATPETLATVSAAALVRLEAPFLAFYARYDAYRQDLTDWRSRHAPVEVVVATPAPVPQSAAAPVVIATTAPVPVVVAARK